MQLRFKHAFTVMLMSALPAHAADIVIPTPGAIQDSVNDRRPPTISTPAEVIYSTDPVAQDDEVSDDTKRFLVSGFAFEGNTVVPEAILQRITERFLDLQLTLAELDRAAADITAFYRDRGFTVARAFVPAQRIEDGLVTIQIIEGRLDSVAFKGNKWYRRNFLQSYVDKFSTGKEGELVTDAALERRMLLLNDLPGLRARATLSPGDNFGTTKLDVDLTEKLFGASIGYSNSGRKEAGANRVDMGVDLNNPLRLGDQLSLRSITSTDNLFKYKRVGYSFPIGAEGMRIALSTLTTDYELGGDFKALDISGKVRSSDATISYPFVRTRSHNVIGALQYRKTTTQQDVFGQKFSNVSLPLSIASLYMNWIGDDSSATAMNLGYSTNAWQNSDSPQEKVSSKLDGDLTYLTSAARNWDFYMHTQGTYSSAALPDTEKFSLGGVDSVRGYPSAQVRGDKGYLVSMEMRR